jgi:hypothetical protein
MYVFCFCMVCATPVPAESAVRARLDLARCQELSGPLFVPGMVYMQIATSAPTVSFFRFPGRFCFFLQGSFEALRVRKGV